MEIHIADEREKQAIFALRFEVFVDEQGVSPEIELDDEDRSATHIIAYDGNMVVGCGRIVFSDDEAHIGRIAVKREYRKTGVGSKICRFIIDYCAKKGTRRIWLNAQIQARGFYEKIGFIAVSEAFEEAGIEHIQMEILR